MSSIKTLPDLIEALGGPSAAARVLRTKPQNITNWRAAGHIPAVYYLAHTEMLERKAGLKVKPGVWGFWQEPQ
jgi:hypothetical protein